MNLNIVSKKIAHLKVKFDPRSQKIMKNIFLSFGVNCGSILVGLIIVPLTINYISKVEGLPIVNVNLKGTFIIGKKLTIYS